MTDWIAHLFENHDLTRMGHGQRVTDLNLGLGWLYYALTRIVRPAAVVVIGSYRGFAPLVFGRAMADNTEPGAVYFIDPSYVDDFWKDPAAVQAHFAGQGVHVIRHFLMTTQQFVETAAFRDLKEVGILFVDGYHSEEQAQFDYEAFRGKMAVQGLTLFHDSIRVRSSGIYGLEQRYEHTVKRYMERLKKEPELQVFDVPFFDGVTLVRRATEAGPRT